MELLSSIPAAIGIKMKIFSQFSGANFSSVILSPIVGNTFQVGGISGATGAVNMSHIRLDVTDGALNKTTRYYTFANLV